MQKLIGFFTLILLFITPPALADRAPFSVKEWNKGIYLFAGGGMSTSSYQSNTVHENWGVGVALKSDLGYFLTDQWALEASSLTKFNRVSGYFIWDTLITLGARYRFSGWSDSSTYGRAFVGRAPTVIKFEGTPPLEYRQQGVDRIRLDGDVYGLALGRMKKTDSGLIWFLEIIGSVQFVESVEGIQIQYEVPEVSFQNSLNNNSTILSMYLTLGVLVF